MKSFSEMHVLHAQAMTFATTSWPEGSLDVVEEQEFVYDPDDDSLMESSRAVGAPMESIAKFGTPEEMRDYYELQGEGQLRYWIKNNPQTCCGVTSSRWEGVQPTPCEKPESCTYCRAVSTTRADIAYGLNLGLTTAKLLLFSQDRQWEKLPTPVYSSSSWTFTNVLTEQFSRRSCRTSVVFACLKKKCSWRSRNKS